MDFFTGDTHLGHSNIVIYCGRPFKDVIDMDETIIRNWNETVTPEDTVYHVGDFSLYYGIEDKQRLLNRLNGTKILVIGNHDIDRVGHWAKLGVKAFKNPIVYGDWILSHQPIMFPDRPNVHGHTHGNIHRGEVSVHGIHICVSVEATEYKPVTADWIRQEIRKRRVDGI